MKSNHDDFDWKSFLGEHPLFGELAADDIDSLSDPDKSRHREFERDDIIFRAGEIGSSFFLIGEGSVKVELSSEDSSSTIISTLYKGDYFGEMAAIDGQHGRAATILANEDCKLLEIRSKPFQQILKANPELEFELLSMLASRLRHVNDHLLKNTRLSYDAKFSLLSEKIESQSKVVEASLNASQAVFEQTKVRTTEIINAAERGRTRITWVMSTLTAGFTLLLAFFGFLGVEKLDTAEQLVKDIEDVKSSVDTVKDEIEASRLLVDKAKGEVDDAKQDFDNLNTRIAKFNADIEASKTAKTILFETLVPVFRFQIEEQVKTGAELEPGALGLKILEANDDTVTTKLFKELFFIVQDHHDYLSANNDKLKEPGLDPEEKSELRDDNEFNQAMISFSTHFAFQYLQDGGERKTENRLADFMSNYLLLVSYAMDDRYVEDVNWYHRREPDRYPRESFETRLEALNDTSSGDEGDRIKALDAAFFSELRNLELVPDNRKKQMAELLN